MKTSIDSRQFDIAKVTFNGALQQCSRSLIGRSLKI